MSDEERSKLDLTDDHKGYRLAWFFEEEGEFGAVLGEDSNILDKAKPNAAEEREAWEYYTANKLAQETGPERDQVGFYWESQSAARGVLRVIRATFKAETSLPEWAKTALENGWKPPKGWKP